MYTKTTTKDILVVNLFMVINHMVAVTWLLMEVYNANEQMGPKNTKCII